MNRLIVARNAGFCFGVERAVQSVLEASRMPGTLFTYGELIHNESVVAHLEEQGVHVLNSVDDIPKDCDDVTVAVRSHGVPRAVMNAIRENCDHVLDLTCPFVMRIHNRVAQAGGRTVYIVGAPDHPEVIGIQGWTQGECHVVPDAGSALSVPQSAMGLAVAQTTIPCSLWEETVAALQERCENLELFASICDTTQKRQDEACELAEQCDLVLVIGGLKSSNTTKLHQLCSQRCQQVRFVQTADQVPLDEVASSGTVGIVAGASTPRWLIEEVRQLCEQCGQPTNA